MKVVKNAIACSFTTLFACTAQLTVLSPSKKPTALVPASTTSNSTSPTPSSTTTSFSFAPTANSLSSDISLFSATTISTPLTLVGPPATTSSVLVAAAAPAMSGPLATTNSIVAATAPNATTSDVLTPDTSVLTRRLDTGVFSATITPMVTFPSTVPAANQFCKVESTFAAVTCTLTGFTIANSLFATGSLSILAYGFTQTTANSLSTTTPLAVRKFKYKWISDINPGASDDTQMIMDAKLNGRVFFWGRNPAGFRKVYSSDGSDFVQIADIYPAGDDISGGTESAVLNGNFYFPLQTNAAGHYKFFKYDGTNITKIMDNNAGGDDSISYPRNIGNYLLFTARDSGGSTRLFSMDGTTLQTLSAINVGNDSFSTYGVTACAGRYYFLGNNPNSKLYSTNGTDLLQVSNTFPGGWDTISDLLCYNGRLYFQASYSGAATNKLSSTDGATVIRHSDIYGGNDDNVQQLIMCNSRLFFAANINATDTKVFSFDGTNLVQISNTNTTGSDSPGLYCLKDNLIVSAYETGGVNRKLFKVSGNTMVKVADIRPGQNDGVNVHFTGSQHMLIGMNDPSNKTRLYAYDLITLRQISNVSAGGDNTQNAGRAVGFSASNDSTGLLDGISIFPFQNASGGIKPHAYDGHDFMEIGEMSAAGLSEAQVFTSYFTSNGRGGVFIPAFSNGVNSKIFEVCVEGATGC